MFNKGKQIKKEVSRYLEKYPKAMKALENGTVIKATGGLNGSAGDHHVITLGEQLESYDILQQNINEEQNSLSALGALPNISHGVITINYSENPIAAIATVQTIAEELGRVYYLTRVAETVKGNIASADTEILKFAETQTTLQNYARDEKTSISLGVGTGSQTVFTGTVATFPIRKQSFNVTIEDDATTYGNDVNGDGEILGVKLYGTIDYATGDYSVTVSSAVALGKNVYASYQIDYEANEASADVIPTIVPKFVPKTVKAQVFTLRTQLGLIERQVMANRFKLDAHKYTAEMLVEELNQEVTGKLILDLYSNAIGTQTWNYNPASPVSDFLHLKGLSRYVQRANSTIVENAHMGEGNVIICGYVFADVLKSTGGEYFKSIPTATKVGPHIFGTYEGRLVIRVPDANIIPKDEALLIWKGLRPFEGAGYDAVYIPLITSGLLPMQNPLVQQQAAASMQAVGTLNPNFITKIVISGA
jgi:hypothetical protein